MTTDRSTGYLISLVHELRKLPVETEWVEFKHNNDNPEVIGEYLSALANAAAQHGNKLKSFAEKDRELCRIFDHTSFDEMIEADNVAFDTKL